MSGTTSDKDAQQAERREEQMREAENLLFSETPRRSAAQELFHGRFAGDLFLPYPRSSAEEQSRIGQALTELKAFCDAHLDPAAIDREADIPRDVIDGLGRLGVLGMTAPESLGGRGFSQRAYCRVLEELGGRCSATSILVNAHHSIGMRSLLLFGTPDQQRRWLPDLVSGRKLAAFALTETQAGSDAANVQTTAVPDESGEFFTLNGDKRYITNGAIADVLTVMARTPGQGKGKSKPVTAFLVTPDMPGFRVIEPRMSKVGIRGTATAKLAFENMRVPRSQILGPEGKGLKIALTVLDFGRTTFGACCTGAAKTCLRLAVEHARTREQFGQKLGEFELVQEKLARMAAWTYAMEAMTTVTAGLIDRAAAGEPIEYMLETAMLKVWSTERLWTIVNDAFQIYGGAAYFTDRPLERMLRDARINQIGEGANEVLTSFIALVGLRAPGVELKSVWDALHHPLREMGTLSRFTWHELARRMDSPEVVVHAADLVPHARTLSRLIRQFGLAAQKALMDHREEIVDRQLAQEPIAAAAMELFAQACVLSRLDHELGHGGNGSTAGDSGRRAAFLFLSHSARRVGELLSERRDNDYAAIRDVAKSLLEQPTQ